MSTLETADILGFPHKTVSRVSGLKWLAAVSGEWPDKKALVTQISAFSQP